MKSIGITGGIGSGKSMVCKILETMGYPVFYSDIEAKKNMIQNTELIRKIIQAFGEESYVDKQLNRNFLANKIFKDEKSKKLLNALVHPTVFQSFENWKKNQTSKLVFNESALLFETGSYKRFDFNWLVLADDDLRASRIMKRDKLTNEEAQIRLKSQLKQEELKNFTTLYIINNESLFLVPQILQLIRKI